MDNYNLLIGLFTVVAAPAIALYVFDVLAAKNAQLAKAKADTKAQLEAKGKQLEEQLKAEDKQMEEQLKAKDKQMEEQLKAKDAELKAKDAELQAANLRIRCALAERIAAFCERDRDEAIQIVSVLLDDGCWWSTAAVHLETKCGDCDDPSKLPQAHGGEDEETAGAVARRG
jgi:hypothetical protein